MEDEEEISRKGEKTLFSFTKKKKDTSESAGGVENIMKSYVSEKLFDF